MTVSLDQLKGITTNQYKIVATYGNPQNWRQVRCLLLATRHAQQDNEDLELKKVAAFVFAFRQNYPQNQDCLLVEAVIDRYENKEYEKFVSYYHDQPISNKSWDIGVMAEFHKVLECNHFLEDLLYPLWACKIDSEPFLKAFRHLNNILLKLPEDFKKRLSFILPQETQLQKEWRESIADAIGEILSDLLDTIIDSPDRQKVLWKNLKQTSNVGHRVFQQAGNAHFYQRKHNPNPSEWVTYLERKLKKWNVPTVIIKTAKDHQAIGLEEQQEADRLNKMQREAAWRKQIQQRFPGCLKLDF